MVQRVPDEYFRQRATESDDIEAPAPQRRLPQLATVKSVASRRVQDGFTPRAVAIIITGAILMAFLVGRLLIFTPAAAPIGTASPTTISSAVASPAPVDAVYDGPVATVIPTTAAGQCTEGGTRENPSALLDENPATPWRCRGSGVGETFSVVFDQPTELVGLRVVNGNIAWADRYQAERRITGLRWTFADGSFFEQGLAANDQNPQEVRFPPMRTGSVVVQVLSSTVPGNPATDFDAVSISSLEFLG